jgi:hypothetical protein
MRHLIAAAAAALALALAACTSSTTTATGGPATAAASAPRAACHAQYEAWKHGPARAAGKALVTQLRAVQAAASAQDIPRLRAALKRVGSAAAASASHPMPLCADPHGYWPAILTRLRSAADNAGSAQGLSAVLLAILPLREVPALESKLSAELKQTTGVSSPLR